VGAREGQAVDGEGLVTCNCGKAQVDIQGARAVVQATDTIAILTLVNDGCVKFEHLECQTCRTVRLPEN
jgi:hypothetical protein